MCSLLVKRLASPVPVHEQIVPGEGPLSGSHIVLTNIVLTIVVCFLKWWMKTLLDLNSCPEEVHSIPYAINILQPEFFT